VAFSPDGTRLATGDDAGVVRVWDLSSGKPLHALHGHGARLATLAFSPDGWALFSGGWDHSIRHWDLTSGKEVRVIKGVVTPTGQAEPVGHTSVVSALALSPGGRWLYSASWDHTICVWESDSGKLARVLKGPERNISSSVKALALAPDGTRLAAALDEEKQSTSVHLWDLTSGSKAATLPGHRGNVSQVAFAPDGKRLASGSVDTTVLLWDVASLNTDGKAVDEKSLARLWDDLASDAKTAYAAVCRGAAAGDAAVARLKFVLKPAGAVDLDKVTGWVRQLDAGEFAQREKASAELLRVGPAAAAALRDALGKSTSAEVKRRLEEILQGFAAEERRGDHALEMLEMIHTAEAKRLLGELAAGAAEARLTDAARAALDRIRKRP
jgi:hypothetical protein